MIIDKKGKLFGKINIIDFLILVVILLAIVVVGARFIKPAGGDAETIQMQFYIEEVDNWVAEKVQVGDALYDGTYELSLGTVTAVETSEPRTWGLTQDGQYVLAPREGYCSLTVTGRMQGKKTETGAEIDGNRYGVGHSMVLYAGDAKMYLRVHDISVVE